MMRAIVRWTLQFRLLVLAAAAGILAFGLTSLPSMSVDAFPEFAPPQVEIQTEALGLSAAEVEQLITSPMEADLLNGVAWVEAIRSKSVPGLSSIQMVFKPGTDLLRARQLVSERLTQARALPNVSAAPVLMQPLSSTSRVMMIRLTSKDMSAIDMSVLARWTMKPGLLAVPGVANVAIWGQRDQQLQVLVDPAQLEAKGVTLDEIIKTTGNSVWVSPLSYLEASTPGTGGFFETGHQRIGVQHVLPITTPEDLGQVPVQGAPGNLLLKDVATVSTDHQPLIGDALLSKEAELLLVIEKFPETNTMDVTRGVDEALHALQPGLPGVAIDTSVYRQASFIDEEVGTLGAALLVTLLLIVALFRGLLPLLAHRLDQPDHHPGVADRGGAGARLARHRDEHHGHGRPGAGTGGHRRRRRGRPQRHRPGTKGRGQVPPRNGRRRDGVHAGTGWAAT